MLGPLRVHLRANQTRPATARLGLSIGRRVGGAVVRSRLKRLLREAFRLEQHALPPGFDLVVVAYPHKELELSAYRQKLVGAGAALAERWAKRASKGEGTGPNTHNPSAGGSSGSGR